MEYVEGVLAFEFGHNWVVEKLDEHAAYRDRIQKLHGTKAVDFFGVYGGDELYFVEVKDFRGHRIENKERLQDGKLAIELGEKVRDSIACIVGVHRTANSMEEVWKRYASLLCNKQKALKVRLWLEYDLPNHSNQKRKALASVSTHVFKSKLTWLTSNVLVCNSQLNCLPDVNVRNLPRNRT